MIGYGAVLRFNLFFGNWWYTHIFTNIYIQVANTFPIIGRIAESTLKLINNIRSDIFGNPIESGLISKNICILPQLKVFFNYLFNLVLFCKSIEPRYGKAWSWDERLLTVRTVFLTTCMLSINLSKNSFIKFSG